MSDKEIADQVKRLLIKATMLRMGEPIAFGSDSYALECAAETIERLMRERDEARKELLAQWCQGCGTVSSSGRCHCNEWPDSPSECRNPVPYIRTWAENLRKSWQEAEARVAELEASLDEDRLEEIITDSIDLDWTPRDAAKAIVRAMGGASHDNG